MWTIDADADAVFSLLVDGQRRVLGVDLVGSYLFGSAATGAFEPGLSDVDTVAVLRSDPTARQLAGLEELHAGIVREVPAWDDRVEAVYLSTYALANFRTTSPAARISPGEPFHPIEVDYRWLIDWYQLRSIGVALYGPPAASIVPFISHVEYVEAVRRHMLGPGWGDGLMTQPQAYVILSMCRGLRTWRTGEYASKREAARWACEELPEYADLIRDALVWRAQSHNDVTSAPDDTRRFLAEVQRLVA